MRAASSEHFVFVLPVPKNVDNLYVMCVCAIAEQQQHDTSAHARTKKFNCSSSWAESRLWNDEKDLILWFRSSAPCSRAAARNLCDFNSALQSHTHIRTHISLVVRSAVFGDGGGGDDYRAFELALPFFEFIVCPDVRRTQSPRTVRHNSCR